MGNPRHPERTIEPYISLVILHTKYTKRCLNGSTARGPERAAVLADGRAGEERGLDGERGCQVGPKDASWPMHNFLFPSVPGAGKTAIEL